MKIIITADWHLRQTKPTHRLDDDWVETQKNTLNQICDYAIKHKLNVCVVGDLFHSNSDTSFLLIQTVLNFKRELNKHELDMYILAGNHDLPFHSSKNLEKSAIGILFKAGVKTIKELNSNFSAPNFDEEVEDKEVVFRHVLTFPDKKSMPPNVNAKLASDLTLETPNAKFIFTGDNHHNFHVHTNNCHVVNSGCLIRQTVDMYDYECGFYVVDTETEDVEFIKLKDEKSLLDVSKNKIIKERETRINSFIDSLKESKSTSLDFLDNVEKSMIENDFNERLELKQTILKLLEV
jgi:hypothetical protein